jgi:group II intron reverse transcriptase/maturase
VIDLDIKGYFDNIDHVLLMKAVEKHVPEKWVRMYIERWLKAGILHEGGRREKSEKGTPQGGVISPLLANLYLHYAFDVWMDKYGEGVSFERYADDIIVHCRSEEVAEKLLEQIKTRLKECGLEVHPEKTRIVYCAQSNRNGKTRRPKKFTFLGYDFKPRKMWSNKKRKAFTGFDLGIGRKAIVRIVGVINEVIEKLPPEAKLDDIAVRLNARLRGWINYYGKFNIVAMRVIWEWLYFRLLRWLLGNFKRFKGGFRKAAFWLHLKYQNDPGLFAHWKLAAPR